MRTVVSTFVVIFLGFSDQAQTLATRDPRYAVQPADVVEITYRFTPEYNQTVTIEPDGFVTLNLVGDIKLQGLTLAQVRTAVLSKVSDRLRDPELTIVLKDFAKPSFVVGGEVTNPGRFDLRGPVNALQAIAIAGGFKGASAKHSQVILFRRTDSEFARTEILDLKAAQKASSLELAELQPGDMLFVPQNRISKIERYIKWVNVGAYVPIF